MNNKKLHEVNADDYIDDNEFDDDEDSLEPKSEKEIEFVDLHTIDFTSHPSAKETQFKALSLSYHPHKGGESEKRNGERTSPRQGNSPTFKQIRMRESNLDEAVEVSHDRYMRSHGKKARDTGNAEWMFTHKQYGEPTKDEVMSHRGSFKDAKKAAQKWAASKNKYSVYVMESMDLEEMKTDSAGAPLTMNDAMKKAVNQAVSLITSKEGDTKKNYDAWAKTTTFGPKLKTIVKQRVMNERVEPGSLKLQSGETVSLSTNDASIINEVLSSLNEVNKKKMEKELMKNKTSFNNILKFAKES